MTKIGAYAGYAVAVSIDFVRRNFFNIAFVAIGLTLASELGTLVKYTSLIGERFYQFTGWYHDMYNDKVGS